jgi:hypothetical protein
LRLQTEQSALKGPVSAVLVLPQSLQSLLRDCLHINGSQLDKLDSQQRRARIQGVAALGKQFKEKGLEYLTERKNCVDLLDKRQAEAFLVYRTRVEENRLADAGTRAKLAGVALKNVELKDKLVRVRLMLREQSAVERHKMQRDHFVEWEKNCANSQKLQELITARLGQRSSRERQSELLNTVTNEMLHRRQISHQKLAELYCSRKVGRITSRSWRCSSSELFPGNGSSCSPNS